MSQLLPKTLVNLIEALGSLPGVGPRTAERYASYLLRTHPAATKNILIRYLIFTKASKSALRPLLS